MVQDAMGGGKINGIKASAATNIKGYSPGDTGEYLRNRTTSIIKDALQKITNNIINNSNSKTKHKYREGENERAHMDLCCRWNSGDRLSVCHTNTR